MTHAQQTQTGAGTTSLIQAAVLAFAVAIALSATVLFAAQIGFTIDLDGRGQAGTAPSLIKAEAAWERQREQQMIGGGASSAVVNSSLNWEQQRSQQTPATNRSDHRPFGPNGPGLE